MALETIKQRALGALPRSLRPQMRIALVGSGLVDPSAAAEIDAHDLVVRFNGCDNYGATGRRVDALVLCNSGGAGKAGKYLANSAEAINLAAWAAAKQFWLRLPPSLLAAMAAHFPKDADDVWADYTQDMLTNRVGIRPWRIFDEATYWAAHHALMDHGASFHHQPSTGVLTLFHIKRTMRGYRVKATLYGFTHQGWEGHPWEAERRLIDHWQSWVTRHPAAMTLERGVDGRS